MSETFAGVLRQAAMRHLERSLPPNDERVRDLGAIDEWFLSESDIADLLDQDLCWHGAANLYDCRDGCLTRELMRVQNEQLALRLGATPAVAREFSRGHYEDNER